MPVINKQLLKKQKKIEYIRRNIDESSAVIFYNFSHAESNEIFLMKKKLKEVGSQWLISKNTLFKKALAGRTDFQVNNNNAFIFCRGDQYIPLKILNEFSFRKDLEKRIQGGIYNGDFINHEVLLKWASLKSREELLNDFCNLLAFSIFSLTMLLGSIN